MTPPPLTVALETLNWPLREPFAISRGTKTAFESLMVTVFDSQGRRGRGEGCAVGYRGETIVEMVAQIEAIGGRIAQGVTRQALLDLLPAGGARCALDGALWDLEAKQTGRSVFARAGVPAPLTMHTACTIGIRTIEAYEGAARARSNFKVLKLKVDASDPLAAIAAARRGAPNVAFIVDPNQAWTVDQLRSFAPALVEFGVVLLEQPVPVGAEPDLDGYKCPVRLCADELIHVPADLHKARGRFDVINIKLDKTGGLTAALHLAELARGAGFGLMVGCMGGSSLAMAPATVLAQQCAFIDLDAPLLLSEDIPDGLTYVDGGFDPPRPELWG